MILAALAAVASITCSLPPGWAEVTASKPRYVIFGETHGTEQSPAMIERTACALARRGERILIAVELSSTENDGLQAAWASPAQGFAERLVSAMPGWKGRGDGVASRAMLAMLVDLHALKSRGARIDVVAFNGARGPEQAARFKDLPGQGPHEAAQAENIRQAADSAPHDRVLVLVGSLHARKRPAESRGVTFEPMAMRLAAPGQIVSLRMVSGAGTMWNCLLKPGGHYSLSKQIVSDDIDCGSHPAGKTAAIHGPPQVALGAPAGGEADPAYDGYYWLGPITGSPPAVAPDKP